MLQLLVVGGLVDEHVVIVLVEDHEVVADWQEAVVDRQESLGKRVEVSVSFPSVFTGLGYCRRSARKSRSQRAVVAGCCERWLADAGCCERGLLGTRVAVNAGRFERWSLCSEHARRYSPLAPDLVAHA